jgi:hypothetical protein
LEVKIASLKHCIASLYRPSCKNADPWLFRMATDRRDLAVSMVIIASADEPEVEKGVEFTRDIVMKIQVVPKSRIVVIVVVLAKFE